jgi:hypothetical protein
VALTDALPHDPLIIKSWVAKDIFTYLAALLRRKRMVAASQLTNPDTAGKCEAFTTSCTTSE